MSTYLLLRDNKESGPYSFEELRSKGLKAYDLVWIDGKSAAWRYPSEIEELKSFAPVVEEQPFDRFFKKTAQAHSAAPANNHTQDHLVADKPRPAPEKEMSFSSAINGSVLPGERSSVPGKRIIYVTLPSDRGVQGMRVPSLREHAGTAPIVPAPERLPLIEKEPARTERSALYTTASQANGKPSGQAEEKLSQESGDMWRTSVEITPRQQGIGLKRILQPVAAIVCILALLAAGIFIGLSIKNTNDSFGFSQKAPVKEEISAPLPTPQQDRSIAQATPVVQPVIPPPAYPNATPVNAGNESTETTTSPDPAAKGSSPVDKTVAAASLVTAPQTAPAAMTTTKKKADRNKEHANRNAMTTLSLKDSSSMSLPAVHREALHRSDEIGMDKDAIRSSISNLVAVGAGKYSVGAFGGISEVQLTVSNHSPYPLDMVVVEVQYIQANKKVFKTENVYFRDLAPGSAMMQVVPKSSRGIRIQYKVTLINSKELGLSYSGI